MATALATKIEFSEVSIPDADLKFLRPTPSHVPPEIIRPYPFILGATSKQPHYTFVSQIHKEPEIFWAERAANGIEGAWIPRTVELLHQVYNDGTNFSAHGSAPFAELIGETWNLVPSAMDIPEHPILRAMVNPLFTPKRIAALEEKIRVYAREAILAFAHRGRCEFMADFAFEFPIRVFLELMGLPQDRVQEFLAWEHKLLHEPNIGEVIKATKSVVAYLREEIEARRANPRDDLITIGIQMEKNGRKLSEDELVGFCFNLFIGGLDTVSTNMAWQFHHLARTPADQALLRSDPSLIPEAIDEMMRFYAAVATVRDCVKEVELGGVRIMPGDKILLPTYLGGHDPAQYGDPEVIRLDRKARHVSFGYGPHLCIGMHLARREMRIALEEALTILPEFSIAPDADITYYLAAIAQPIELPLVWKV